jgi:ribosomal protein S18 acetylase RimI-like enzyme
MIHIRHAGLADLGILIPLFRGYLDFYGQPASEPDAGAFLAAHLDAGTSTILVAEHEGLGVGFAQLYPSWDSLSLRSRWILYDLFVDPDRRRNGVGRALVASAIDVARDSGAGSMSLDTAVDNEPAQGLYEAMGFERDEVFVTYHHALSE